MLVWIINICSIVCRIVQCLVHICAHLHCTLISHLTTSAALTRPGSTLSKSRIWRTWMFFVIHLTKWICSLISMHLSPEQRITGSLSMISMYFLLDKRGESWNILILLQTLSLCYDTASELLNCFISCQPV